METDEQSGFQDYFLNCSETKTMDCDKSNEHKHCKLCIRLSPCLFVVKDISVNLTWIMPCLIMGSSVIHVNYHMIIWEKVFGKRFHFHCPVCQCTIINCDPFIKHLKHHDSKDTPQTHGDCEMDNKRVKKTSLTRTMRKMDQCGPRKIL